MNRKSCALILSFCALASAAAPLNAGWADLVGKGKTAVGVAGTIPVNETRTPQQNEINILQTAKNLALIMGTVATLKVLTSSFWQKNSAPKVILDSIAGGLMGTFVARMLNGAGEQHGAINDAELSVNYGIISGALKGIIEYTCAKSLLMKSIASGILEGGLCYLQTPSKPKPLAVVAETAVGGAIGACLPALARSVVSIFHK